MTLKDAEDVFRAVAAGEGRLCLSPDTWLKIADLLRVVRAVEEADR